MSVAGHGRCACLTVCLCVSRLFGIDIGSSRLLPIFQVYAYSVSEKPAGEAHQRPGRNLDLVDRADAVTEITSHHR